ncbi:MAG: FHA domain-containing protein [Chloroflexi bacterium]|nr:FHA domain-containing protein [Chloroflexota bacterium]
MAYGRLDVFWPDGLFKTYLLSDATISIGRSPGNSIPLETETLSRYHASLTHQDGQVQLTDLDSANGTFVDGVRLKANEPRTLYDGEEIGIGELRLIYHFLDETPTRPITVPEEATQRIELEEAPFYIEVEEPEIAIPPGAHISARLSITNTGSEAERYRVEVSGVPKDWARIDRPDLEIAPEHNADVIVNFKPRRRSDSAPGEYVITISVYGKSNPHLKLKGTVHLIVLPFSGFGMALERNRLKPGERFRLHVHNQGSAPLPLNLLTRDFGDSLTFAIPNAHLTLPPGQRTVLQGQVKPRKQRFFGDAREHSFDLIARSGDAASFTIAARGYVDEKPALPAWAAFALGGLALALLLVTIIGLGVLLQPAPALPAISDFKVSAERLAQGEPLTVSWAVVNADELHLTVNGAEIATDLTNSSVQINTATLDGAVNVVLVAASGSRQTQASDTVQVFKPITITTFAINPPQVVLYVAQTITLDWNASGADTTTFSGLENFTSTPSQATYGASGSISVVGIPTGPLILTLNAQNKDTMVQQPLTVEMIAPQCSASNGDASLRASPDPLDQIIATIPQGTTVIVDAQDAQSQWLRVQLTGGAHGWGERTAFACADNFSVDDLYKALIVPTARPLFTIVPTLSTSIPTLAAATAVPTNKPPSTLPNPTTAPTFTKTPTRTPQATAAG